MDAVGRRLVRYPRLVLATTLAITLVLGWFAVQVRIESSLESVLPAGDPAVAYYDQIRRLFGSDDVGVVGVRSDDVFSPETLARIARVTTALSKLEGVEGVLSLTNARDVAADVFTPPPLLPRIPPTPEDVALLRAKLAQVPLYRQNLVAPDWKGAAINIFFKPLTDAQYRDLGLDARIRAILEAEQDEEHHWYYTGAARVKQAAVDLMRRDLFRFTPLALALVVFALWVSFRTKRGVVLPVVAVGVALVWTLGVLQLAGGAITLGTFVLPPLLLVVGASYAIHVMARYYEAAEEGSTRAEVALEGFRRVWVPLSISAVVTSIGFGALAVNRIPAIFTLGVFAVVGVVALTLVCLVAMPAALAMLPVERVAARARDGRPALASALARLARHVAGSRRRVGVEATLIAALALLGVTRIRVDSDFLTYFSPRAPVRQDNEVINREIVGSNPFYIVIHAPERGGLRQVHALQLIKELQHHVAALPGITSSVSIVDYLELLESGLNRSQGGDLIIDDQGNAVPAPPPKTFWDDPAQLNAVLKMIDASPKTFASVITSDFQATSILVRTRISGSRGVEAVLRDIRQYIASHFPAEYGVRLTGSLVLMTGTTSEIVLGQVESLAIALGAIFAVLSLMFLSVRVGFLAILPNVLPIVVFFGLMGWLGIDLNLGTSLIATIALGIAVDSTVHYMSRLNRELRGEEDQEAAIRRTLTTVGQPIVFTTVALVLGFITFAASGFSPIQSFGILTSVTLAAGLLANLVLLPAVLSTFKVITLWDLVGVKLGEAPTHTIPLFEGMRPSQARVVVLMGEVRHFAPGETIVRQGEQGDEMFVVLNGRAEVWGAADGGRQRLAEVRRGDVFGEMGLVRRTERSADVVATENTDVLAVDETFLKRIQRRYPRIASRVFLNLTKILSDRLERANRRFLRGPAAPATAAR